MAGEITVEEYQATEPSYRTDYEGAMSAIAQRKLNPSEREALLWKAAHDYAEGTITSEEWAAIRTEHDINYKEAISAFSEPYVVV
jgi:hypothetical protein